MAVRDRGNKEIITLYLFLLDWRRVLLELRNKGVQFREDCLCQFHQHHGATLRELPNHKHVQWFDCNCSFRAHVCLRGQWLGKTRCRTVPSPSTQGGNIQVVIYKKRYIVWRTGLTHIWYGAGLDMCSGASDIAKGCLLCKESVEKIQQELKPELQMEANCNITNDKSSLTCSDGLRELARIDWICKNHHVELLAGFAALKNTTAANATEACTIRGSKVMCSFSCFTNLFVEIPMLTSFALGLCKMETTCNVCEQALNTAMQMPEFTLNTTTAADLLDLCYFTQMNANTMHVKKQHDATCKMLEGDKCTMTVRTAHTSLHTPLLSYFFDWYWFITAATPLPITGGLHHGWILFLPPTQQHHRLLHVGYKQGKCCLCSSSRVQLVQGRCPPPSTSEFTPLKLLVYVPDRMGVTFERTVCSCLGRIMGNKASLPVMYWALQSWPTESSTYLTPPTLDLCLVNVRALAVRYLVRVPASLSCTLHPHPEHPSLCRFWLRSVRYFSRKNGSNCNTTNGNRPRGFGCLRQAMQFHESKSR